MMHDPIHVRYLAATCALALMLSSGSVAAKQRVTLVGELGGGFDDNITTTLSSAKARSSSFLLSTLVASTRFKLPQARSLILRADFAATEYNQFSSLSNLRLRAGARLIGRSGAGFFALSYGVDASAGILDFNSRMRSGHVYDLRLFVGQALTTKIHGHASLEASLTESDSEVFDTQTLELSAGAEWRLRRRTAIYTSLAAQVGDVVSSGLPTVQVLAEAEAVGGDDAFGGLRSNELAYRLNARTGIATLGMNWALSPNMSLDGQVRAVASDAGKAGSYRRNQALISMLFQF